MNCSLLVASYELLITVLLISFTITHVFVVIAFLVVIIWIY